MAKLRLIFSKEGRAVYISHLDLMRTFQRVFMREGLILKHSQGFHPHPIISFALPLSVGQSSRCEILDFEVMSDTRRFAVFFGSVREKGEKAHEIQI